MKVKVISSAKVFKGKRFSVERRVLDINGRRAERDIVVFPESVVVLPLLRDDVVLLIKQYRAALNDYIYEAPAGIIEPGETVKGAAQRELVEETGYTAGELMEIGSFYPVPGYSTECMHFVIARNLEYVGAKPEPYEVIEPVVVSVEKAIEMIKANTINDLKTAAIILYYYSLLRGGKIH